MTSTAAASSTGCSSKWEEEIDRRARGATSIAPSAVTRPRAESPARPRAPKERRCVQIAAQPPSRPLLACGGVSPRARRSRIAGEGSGLCTSHRRVCSPSCCFSGGEQEIGRSSPARSSAGFEIERVRPLRRCIARYGRCPESREAGRLVGRRYGAGLSGGLRSVCRRRASSSGVADCLGLSACGTAAG